METSLKTGFAQIFSCCPKNLSCPKLGRAAAPLAPPARTPINLPQDRFQSNHSFLNLIASQVEITPVKNLRVSKISFKQS